MQYFQNLSDREFNFIAALVKTEQRRRWINNFISSYSPSDLNNLLEKAAIFFYHGREQDCLISIRHWKFHESRITYEQADWLFDHFKDQIIVLSKAP